MESFNPINVTATDFSIFILINGGSCISNCCRSLLFLIKLLTIDLRNRNMSKSFSFIILALLVVANTEGTLISTSHNGQGSYLDASFSINPTTSPITRHCWLLRAYEGRVFDYRVKESSRRLYLPLSPRGMQKNCVISYLFYHLWVFFTIMINCSDIEIVLIKEEINPLWVCAIMPCVFYACIQRYFVVYLSLTQSTTEYSVEILITIIITFIFLTKIEVSWGFRVFEG